MIMNAFELVMSPGCELAVEHCAAYRPVDVEQDFRIMCVDILPINREVLVELILAGTSAGELLLFTLIPERR